MTPQKLTDMVVGKVTDLVVVFIVNVVWFSAEQIVNFFFRD